MAFPAGVKTQQATNYLFVGVCVKKKQPVYTFRPGAETKGKDCSIDFIGCMGDNDMNLLFRFGYCSINSAFCHHASAFTTHALQ